MNKIILTVLMFSVSVVLSAKQPPTGTSTIVGGVLVDLYGSYWIYDAPLRGGLPIRVAVEYEKNAKTEMYAFELETDAQGYFKIENAPEGKYILKAIEMHIGQSTHITAASEYGRWAKGELGRP